MTTTVHRVTGKHDGLCKERNGLGLSGFVACASVTVHDEAYFTDVTSQHFFIMQEFSCAYLI